MSDTKNLNLLNLYRYLRAKHDHRPYTDITEVRRDAFEYIQESKAIDVAQLHTETCTTASSMLSTRVVSYGTLTMAHGYDESILFLKGQIVYMKGLVRIFSEFKPGLRMVTSSQRLMDIAHVGQALISERGEEIFLDAMKTLRCFPEWNTYDKAIKDAAERAYQKELEKFRKALISSSQVFSVPGGQQSKLPSTRTSLRALFNITRNKELNGVVEMSPDSMFVIENRATGDIIATVTVVKD